MPKDLTPAADALRDRTHAEAFHPRPTDLVELIASAQKERGLEPETIPTEKRWESMSKRARVAYLRRRDQDVAQAITEEQARQKKLEARLKKLEARRLNRETYPERNEP